MNLRITIIIMALLITVSPAVAKHPNVTRKKESIYVDGVKRRFTVCIPSDCRNMSVPLVIVLHGAMGNGWFAEYDSQMTPKAQKEHFIVAYPNGTGLFRRFFLTWNVGPCSGSGWKKVDDLGFIRKMIEVLENEYDINPNRIYVTGLSNGGMLAYRIAAEMPELVAAISPVSCCMYGAPDEVTSPVSVMAFHGIKDRVIPYNGGDGSFYGYRIKTRPVIEGVEYWVRRDRCNPVPNHEEIGSVTEEIYDGGADNTEVCLYIIKNGGHAWPGGKSIAPLACRPVKCLCATDLMWDFFCKHSKQHGGETAISLSRSIKCSSDLQ